MDNNVRYNLAAARLKSCRIKAGLTQEQVGNICGVKKSTVGRWENGKIKNIGLPIIQLLAHYYNVSPAWLSGLDMPTDENPIIEDKGHIEEFIQLYNMLDFEDQSVIRGEIKGMLRAEKYKKDVEDVS
jgi:transcriptional regulator with XRE-family HTH domain